MSSMVVQRFVSIDLIFYESEVKNYSFKFYARGVLTSIDF